MVDAKFSCKGCELGLRRWQIPSDIGAVVLWKSVYAQPPQRADMAARNGSALLRVSRSRASLLVLLGGDNPDMLLRAIVDRVRQLLVKSLVRAGVGHGISHHVSWSWLADVYAMPSWLGKREGDTVCGRWMVESDGPALPRSSGSGLLQIAVVLEIAIVAAGKDVAAGGKLPVLSPAVGACPRDHNVAVSNGSGQYFQSPAAEPYRWPRLRALR